jgi:nucleotide-binding universal stress UspA family protein
VEMPPGLIARAWRKTLQRPGTKKRSLRVVKTIEAQMKSGLEEEIRNQGVETDLRASLSASNCRKGRSQLWAGRRQPKKTVSYGNCNLRKLRLIYHLGVENAEKEKHKVKSLLEPEITITGPPGDKLRSFRHSIHPHTSFDEEASGFNTPVDSDAEEDLTDIKRAQKLSVNMTSIVSTPATGRCVRTIYRGDFAKMQQEAHDNQRRVRKYLVATDLSEEAAHALEWTIGTVLRDGDTLLAIYCVDEELGISSNEPVMDDVQLQAQAAAVAATTKHSIPMPALPSVLASPLSSAFKLESSSANASPMGRGRGKAEQERFRAVQDITDRVSRLLRRTKLQVKVVIEVIHCKSPKHLITEVIDYLSPTLVILGSRGRSALKGLVFSFMLLRTNKPFEYSNSPSVSF